MSRNDNLGIVWKKAIRPEDSNQGWDFATGPYTNFGHREWREWGMHIEKDVPIPTRHGTLYADIFRPDPLEPGTKLPIIMGTSPYGKHARPQYPYMGVTPDLLSHYSIGEAPDPGHWVKYGYAVAYVDGLGSWHSDGDYVSWGSAEAEAGADAVDWLGSQEWSNGAVALGGASYYSMIGYRIAAQQPVHLKALTPWEGGIRTYDGFINHGGIPSAPTAFFPWWSDKYCSHGQGKMEDLAATNAEHPDFDEFWADKTPDLSGITIPILASTGWLANQDGSHLAGTIDAWRAVSSEHKWLIGWPYGHMNKWYRPEMLELQRQFYDYFLAGKGELPDWPRVQISSRVTLDEDLPLRGEADFPLPGTHYTTFHLDGATSTLSASPADSAQASYDATERGAGARFDLTFEEDTEVTGYMRLRVWVRIDAGNEADLFVAVHKLDASGEPMPLGPSLLSLMAPHLTLTATELPITRGWLRASYRELDPVHATDFQPRHTYRRREPLTPGEPIAVDVELWPTSATFRAGEGLRLLISGKDIANAAQPLAHEDDNAGTHTLITGEQHDSYLVLPIIPLDR